jgi:hypothetical protein
MKKLLLLLALCFVLGSCEQTTTTDVQKLSTNYNISYFIDNRTGLCFGALSSRTHGGWSVVSITCVPCDSVKHLLTKYE